MLFRSNNVILKSLSVHLNFYIMSSPLSTVFVNVFVCVVLLCFCILEVLYETRLEP